MVLYQNILNGRVSFPRSFSKHLKDLISKLAPQRRGSVWFFGNRILCSRDPWHVFQLTKKIAPNPSQYVQLKSERQRV